MQQLYFSLHMVDIAVQLAEQIQTFITTNPTGVVILWGATATGKSALSIEIAQQLPVEIISADSRQVYKGMDIGTAKVSREAREQVPHHLIDIVTPDQVYTAGQWKKDATACIEQIQARGNIPLIVGGTGLYIDMIYKNFNMPDVSAQESRREEMMQKETAQPGYLFEQLKIVDPEEAMKHHPNSVRYVLRALEIQHVTGKKKSELAQEQPVERPLLMIGLRRSKEETNSMINKRVKEMFARGLIEEVQGLLTAGYTGSMPAMESIGYQEIIAYLAGEYDLEKTIELLKRNSHRYAKRQRSRFRRYIAEGKVKPKENTTYKVYELSDNQGGE